jgi:hypothetical protein
MNTPLDIAIDIGRIVLEARASEDSLDLSGCADDLLSRFPQAGISRRQICETLKEEAGAVGLSVH